MQLYRVECVACDEVVKGKRFYCDKLHTECWKEIYEFKYHLKMFIRMNIDIEQNEQLLNDIAEFIEIHDLTNYF